MTTSSAPQPTPASEEVASQLFNDLARGVQDTLTRALGGACPPHAALLVHTGSQVIKLRATRVEHEDGHALMWEAHVRTEGCQ